MFSWNSLEKPIIALSPMADLTDSPFCQIAKRFECPVVFREMISSEAVVRGNQRSLNMGSFTAAERPIIQQIFGSDPKIMAEAVRQLDETYAPDGFDINMGCPVYKIVSNFNGAALMNEPERAAKIIHALRAATKTPISVKIRLGWDDPKQCLEFIRILENAGADLVTIHGRTKRQQYSGRADWAAIGAAKRVVSIPVLANGDIVDLQTARAALLISGADGVLIARGALGNPWIFRELVAGLHRQDETKPPSLSERCQIIKDHAHLHSLAYGERGLVTFRKHLSWYFKGLPQVKHWRALLVRVNSWSELESILLKFQNDF